MPTGSSPLARETTQARLLSGPVSLLEDTLPPVFARHAGRTASGYVPLIQPSQAEGEHDANNLYQNLQRAKRFYAEDQEGGLG